MGLITSVKTKTINWYLLLLHLYPTFSSKIKYWWFGDRLTMCQSGATCLPVYCCFSELALWKLHYQCNQYLSPLMLWVRLPLKWGVLNTILCVKICHGLAIGWWFSLGATFSSSNKTDSRDMTEILLKVALHTKTITHPFSEFVFCRLTFKYIVYVMFIVIYSVVILKTSIFVWYAIFSDVNWYIAIVISDPVQSLSKSPWSNF